MSNSLYQQLRAVRKEAQQKGNFNPETWTYSDPFCAKVEEVITDALVALVELQERNDDLVRQNQLEPSNNLKVYNSRNEAADEIERLRKERDELRRTPMTDTPNKFDPIPRLQQIAITIEESGVGIFDSPPTAVYYIYCAINEIIGLRKERDEARREICEERGYTAGAAHLEAERRGWDCYKESVE